MVSSQKEDRGIHNVVEVLESINLVQEANPLKEERLKAIIMEEVTKFGREILQKAIQDRIDLKIRK